MLPRRHRRAAGVCVALACAALSACADELSTDAATPTFVSVPANPADDPQLDALDGLIDGGGENVARPSAMSEDQVDKLAQLVTELSERVGADAKVARVNVGTTTVTVRMADGPTTWTLIPSLGLVSRPMDEWDAEQLGDASLDVSLADVDPDVPRQVLAGIDRRTPNRRVASINLVGDDGAPLTWRFVVDTGRSPATVTAAPDGSVLAVAWWE